MIYRCTHFCKYQLMFHGLITFFSWNIVVLNCRIIYSLMADLQVVTDCVTDWLIAKLSCKYLLLQRPLCRWWSFAKYGYTNSCLSPCIIYTCVSAIRVTSVSPLLLSCRCLAITITFCATYLNPLTHMGNFSIACLSASDCYILLCWPA